MPPSVARHATAGRARGRIIGQVTQTVLTTMNAQGEHRVMDQLDFEFHRRQYEVLAGTENAEATAYFMCEALDIHSLLVRDALRSVQYTAATIAPTLSNEEAKFFMLHGPGRRLGMIWVSYSNILDHIATDRIEPLPQDDVATISRDLNVIYINIPGVLDNYAWCLLHQVATDKTKKLPPVKVGLFSRDFMDDSNLTSLRPLLEEFGNWHKELKTRRDPAVHRIPLYVPPAVLNPEELDRYRELEDQIADAFNNQDFEQVEELNDQQGKIGTFMSCFLHHPDDDIIPIYPTVPQDIANLIKIVKRVHDFLHERER